MQKKKKVVNLVNLEFAVMGGTGGTTDHHPDAFHNDR